MARATERSCEAPRSGRSRKCGGDDFEAEGRHWMTLACLARADDSIRVPSVPVRLLRELASSLSMQDIAEPEGLPEGLPEGQAEGL